MKKYLLILIAVFVAIGGFFAIKNFVPNLKTDTSGAVTALKKTLNTAIDSKIGGITTSVPKANKTVQKQISTPPPLVTKTAPVSPSTALSKLGVLVWTNVQRDLNGKMPSLTSNSILDQIANLRLQDMFSRQYFEHISPIGEGASDLARTNGYEFIVIGENIALGNFESDQKLVAAWMASPGHRANILNARFVDIGTFVDQQLAQRQFTLERRQHERAFISAIAHFNFDLRRVDQQLGDLLGRGFDRQQQAGMARRVHRVWIKAAPQQLAYFGRIVLCNGSEKVVIRTSVDT